MHRLRVVAAGIAVAVVAVLASVVPASAHDDLLSSSPSAGERLPSAPDEISLRFSADVMDVGAQVIVADGDGTDWVAADAVVASGTVSVLLESGMPIAGYEVRWRVVSADGHPISGVIPFTVGDAVPLERAAASAEPSPEAAPASTGDAGVPRVVVIAAIGAGLALAVFAVVLLLRRRAGRDAQP